MNGMVHMQLTALKKLVVALAMTLEVAPEDIAATFNDAEACQEFFDKLVKLQNQNREAA